MEGARERGKYRSYSAASLRQRSPIGVTLYYLPDEPMEGDIDNIVKPILDALSRHIYVDDRQVERLLVQKFEPGIPFELSNPTATVAAAVTGPRPVLYVRLSDRPREEAQ